MAKAAPLTALKRTLRKSSIGPLAVTTTRISRRDLGAPHDILVLHPEAPGDYPLLQFHHGFALKNSFYQQFSSHIASHGFIVTLPQLYRPGVTALFSAFIPGIVPDPYNEAQCVARTLVWTVENLKEMLKEKRVGLQDGKYALGGHSRGSQALLLSAMKNISSPRHTPKLLVLVDPVDGVVKLGRGLQRCVLKETPWILDMPVIVFGGMLGVGGSSPAAPRGHNFDDFFVELQRGGSHCSKIVFPNHGHLDYLDDSTPGILGCASKILVPGGESGKEPVRKLSAAVTISFLESVFTPRSSSIARLATLLNGKRDINLEHGLSVAIDARIETRRVQYGKLLLWRPKV